MDTTVQNSSGMSKPKSDGLAIDISALADSAKAKLGEIGEPVKDKAIEVASKQKDSGADQLQVAARAVHGAARELESAMPQFADYIHEIGGRLEQVASDVRADSIDGLMSKLGDFSRNQPALVFGGAVIAGLALSRFLRSSAQKTPYPDEMGAEMVTSSQTGMSGIQSGPMTMQSGTAPTGMAPGGIGSTGTFKPGRSGGGIP
jgi:hypothetical protein